MDVVVVLNEAGHGSLIELRAVYQDSGDGITPFLVLKENGKFTMVASYPNYLPPFIS